MAERTCRCGASFAIHERERNPRKWCSEACRVRSLREERPQQRDRDRYFPRKAISYATCGYCHRLFVVRGPARGDKQYRCCRQAECRRLYNNERVRTYFREYRQRTGEVYTSRYRDKRLAACREWSEANKIDRTCELCRRLFRAKRPDSRTCSRRCQGLLRRGDSRLPVLHPEPSPAFRLPKSHPARGPEPRPARLFVMGWCPRDGAPFVVEGQLTSRWCSDLCQKAEHRSTRRARKRDAFVAHVNRRAIYERDGWMCGICGDPVDREAKVPDPAAPVLDHIVPLARGGTHEPANVRCAHFYCNNVKSDRLDGEMAA